LPALQTFAADVIFLSTGLDSHYDDLYHYLTEEDLHWLTSQIVNFVTLPHTQILSILEGGYSLAPTHNNNNAQEASAGPGVGGEGGDGPHQVRGGKGGSAGRYGIKHGDGGLVKGTLAHVAALGGR
jgi:hypothetical protein